MMFASRQTPTSPAEPPVDRVRAWLARQHPLSFVGVAVVAAILLWTFVGVAIRSWQSAGNRPWETDACALGRLEADRFRALTKRVRDEGRFRAGWCAKDPSGHADCFGRETLARVAELQDAAGGGMEGRLLALHALMRAGKAILLSQSSVPTPKPITFEGLLSPETVAILRRNEHPPPVPRAEILVYALDAREFDLPGPVWRSGGRGFGGGWQRGSNPTGDYAVARLAVTLSDPALDRDDDRDNGAVKEEADYLDAAWSDKTGDRATRYAPSSGPRNVHEATSSCPRRPVWLDIAVQPRPRGSAAAARRRLFQRLDDPGDTPGPAAVPPPREAR